jgi:hypothetical protein
MSDFGVRLIKVVIGGLVAYVVSALLITAFITGTTDSDNLIQTVVPIVIAAGVVIGIVVASFKTSD